MNKLIYTIFNLNLKDRHLKLQKQKIGDDKMDPLVNDDMHSDDEWITPIYSKIFEVEEVGVDNKNEDIGANFASAIRFEQASISQSNKRKKMKLKIQRN